MSKKVLLKKKSVDAVPLNLSELKVYDIEVNKLVMSEDNPNEQDEKTFDTLVEKIKEAGKPLNKNGFIDEPLHLSIGKVGKDKGKYIIVSGHHRYKAAKMLKMDKVPCIIHEDWDDARRQLELVARNNLRGKMNPEKFTKLYNDICKKGLSAEYIKIQMGFTKKDAFDKIYKTVANSISANQRQRLDDAKESIKSIDDLSSVLNTIFKEHGNRLDHGFAVFSFGGKKHHYIPIDRETHKMLEAIESECSDKEDIGNIFKEILKNRAL